MRGPVSAIEEQEDGVDHFSEEEFTSSKRARGEFSCCSLVQL